MADLLLELVSAEKEIYSGEVERVQVTGSEGEMGVEPGHSPLLAMLQPGDVRAELADGEEKIFYISGGIVEVQPHRVTILSDTAIRAEDIDEAAAEKAVREAEQALERHDAEFEYAQARAELARAVAQIRALRKLKKKLK